MEICPVSVQSPAIPLRRGRLSTPRAPPSLFRPCVSPLDSHYTVDTAKPSDRMFILGMGFVGRFFAQDLKKHGWVVSGTCTSSDKKKKLEEMGFNVSTFDANDPEPGVLDTLNCHTHLLISIPPLLGIGDPLLQHGELLKKKLKDGNIQWLCYLSSTSVYGDCGGAWVNEDYPIIPTSESAKERLAAEEGWLNLGRDLGCAAQVFRLGGIYGPGRSAIDTIIKQERFSEAQKTRSSKRYTSRVHVADICQCLNASIGNPSPRRVYNIVDDDPAPRMEVFTFAKNLVEKKWPAHVKHVTSPDGGGAFRQGGSSRGEKRVSNYRMKDELQVKLIHPSYRSGLQSILDLMDSKV